MLYATHLGEALHIRHNLGHFHCFSSPEAARGAESNKKHSIFNVKDKITNFLGLHAHDFNG